MVTWFRLQFAASVAITGGAAILRLVISKVSKLVHSSIVLGGTVYKTMLRADQAENFWFATYDILG